MDFKKFENFNWIEMDSKDQNLDLNETNPFLSISIHFRLLGWKLSKILMTASKTLILKIKTLIKYL